MNLNEIGDFQRFDREAVKVGAWHEHGFVYIGKINLKVHLKLCIVRTHAYAIRRTRSIFANRMESHI